MEFLEDIDQLSAGPESESMDDDEFHAFVKAQVEDAIDYIEDFVSPERSEATKFYQGQKLGNEVEGRSQYVSMDLRDAVQAVLPSLLKIFHSSERVVEFVPKGPEDVMYADQATDYVRYIFSQDNNGFMLLHSCLKDMLIRRDGFMKAYWSDEIEVETYTYENLDDNELGVMLGDPELSLVSLETRQEEDNGMMMPAMHDAVIQRRTDKGRVRIECLPPEEVFLSRSATDLYSANLVGHRRMMTSSELIALGYDLEEFEDMLGGNDDALQFNEEYTVRKPEMVDSEEVHAHQSQRKVHVTECWVRIDYDGDGIAELRHILMVGAQHEKVLLNEPVARCPIFSATCDPEPHDWTGLGFHDLVKDIQEVKSSIQRSLLDSLALSVHPRMAFLENAVNVEDLMDSDAVGSLIRMRQPNAIQPLQVPFVGQAAFPVLEYYDGLKDNRTGISKSAQGLDPESLQSSTRAGVQATISAAALKCELIARIFSEQLMKPMFSHILKLVCEHQPKERIIRLRNQFLPMDPRTWDKGMDVAVNVGLGQNDEEAKLAALMQIKQSQEQILQIAGMQNPLVNLRQYYNTLVKISEYAGFRDSTQFFTDPATVPPPEPPPEKPSPEELLAQVQMEQIRAQMAVEEAKLTIQRDKHQTDAALKQSEMELDANLKMADMQAKYQTATDVQAIRGIIEQQKTLVKNQGLLEK